MKVINIYLDDKTHKQYDEIKSKKNLTWRDVLEIGIEQSKKKEVRKNESDKMDKKFIQKN